MTLTTEQIETLKRGQPVRVPAPEVGQDIVVIRESDFRDRYRSLENDEELAAWAKLGKEAAAQWGAENPY